MNNLIIGRGEIGQGLYEIISPHHKTTMYDITDETKPEGEFTVLNICIPGSIVTFPAIVIDYVKEYNPALVIIHSTVPVGTTKELNETLDIHVVDSPVRGVHWKSMGEGVKTYVKYIGYDTVIGRQIAESFYSSAGIKYKSFSDSRTTELGKILSTTDYGVNLMFAKMKKDLCDEYGLDYNKVVYDFTETYNEGIMATGEQFRKQLLTPPGDKIGGHCVVENAYMLYNQVKEEKQFNDAWTIEDILHMVVEVGKGDRELNGF